MHMPGICYLCWCLLPGGRDVTLYPIFTTTKESIHMIYDNLPLAKLAYRTEAARRKYREKGTENAWRDYEDLYLALGRRAMYPRLLTVRCEMALTIMTGLAIDAE